MLFKILLTTIFLYIMSYMIRKNVLTWLHDLYGYLKIFEMIDLIAILIFGLLNIYLTL